MTISRVHSLDELFKFSDLEKKSHSTLVTNCYHFADYFREKVEKNSVFIINENNSAMILTELIPDNYSLHFFTTNLNSFEKTLKEKTYQRKTLVELPSFIAGNTMGIFQNNGFSNYETFLQLVSKPDSTLRCESRLDMYFAELADAEDILELLQINFDPKVDQIPSLFQIREYIVTRNVLRLKEDDKIASCVVFFETKKNLKVHFLVTNPNVQGRGNAVKLLRLLRENFDGLITLWVKESNRIALEFYVKRGFHASENKRFFLEGIV